MGILDTIKSASGNIAGQEQKNDLMTNVMHLIGGQTGGLQGLIGMFASKGLGDVVNSWVSTGENKPISPDQVQQVLGDDKVNTLAAKTGMDQATVKNQLAEMLPQMVDKLTPDGKIPEGDIVSKGMAMLGGLFGRH